jgi:nitrite reductase/ring-hydroxylating ferredoxin subunit/uncharacterized membrane protein
VLPTGAVRDALHGLWLGHPLHPILTDLPIGAWTSASILDLIGGRRGERAARMLVGFGCLTAVPTAVSGAADWSRLDSADQRVGIVHATANSIALVLYVWSWRARGAGRRGRGITLALGGAMVATAGGYLGGHLVYRRAVGANRDAGIEPPENWSEASAVSGNAEATVVRLDDVDILVVEDLGTGVAARCSHQAGPLAAGERIVADGERCVVCPWHGSTFRLRDGAVVHGPATSPQPAYDVERADGARWRVRAGRRGRERAAPALDGGLRTRRGSG